MEDPRYPDIVVELVGEDGNAFAIMGNVSDHLRDAGVPEREIAEYRTESMSGDYDHLLRTAMRWVTVE